MAAFRIFSDASVGLKAVFKTVDTHVLPDVAQAAIQVEKSITNPLYLLTMGQVGTGIFRPDLASKVTSRVINGTGSSAFDDAVRSLHGLAERHGVSGISLSPDPGLYGGLAFRTSDGILGPGAYVSGQPVIDKIGRDAAFRIDRAARYVMDFVDASA